MAEEELRTWREEGDRLSHKQCQAMFLSPGLFSRCFSGPPLQDRAANQHPPSPGHSDWLSHEHVTQLGQRLTVMGFFLQNPRSPSSDPEGLVAISCPHKGRALVGQQGQETEVSYHLSPWIQLPPRGDALNLQDGLDLTVGFGVPTFSGVDPQPGSSTPALLDSRPLFLFHPQPCPNAPLTPLQLSSCSPWSALSRVSQTPSCLQHRSPQYSLGPSWRRPSCGARCSGRTGADR